MTEVFPEFVLHYPQRLCQLHQRHTPSWKWSLRRMRLNGLGLAGGLLRSMCGSKLVFGMVHRAVTSTHLEIAVTLGDSFGLIYNNLSSTAPSTPPGTQAK